MLQERTEQQNRIKTQYGVNLATHQDEVRLAQRLRWHVFAEEMGARLTTSQTGYDIDMFDAYCDHLLVRNLETGEAVGTYRILGPDAAKRLGCFYTDSEFDLTRLQHMRPRMVEIGRSCVHAEHRSGGVITLLWAGLAEYMLKRGHEYLIGCASVGMRDGGHNAASLWHALRVKHLAPIEWRVFPRNPLPLDAYSSIPAPVVPPLIKGYLRAGSSICGEPAWDPDFNTADLPILLAMKNLNPSYARHFMKQS